MLVSVSIYRHRVTTISRCADDADMILTGGRFVVNGVCSVVKTIFVVNFHWMTCFHRVGVSINPTAGNSLGHGLKMRRYPSCGPASVQKITAHIRGGHSVRVKINSGGDCRAKPYCRCLLYTSPSPRD